MAENSQLEQLLLSNLTVVDRVGTAMARRQGLSSDEAADLIGWVRLRLVEDDYAILRKFRGDSAFSTYLTVVVSMLARDHYVQQRGRWRPSAAAIRSGTLAIKLETLVYRKGYSLDAAFQILRSAGETTLTDRELTAIWSSLPRREPMRPQLAGDESLAHVAGSSFADAALLHHEGDASRREVVTLMENWMSELPAEDRLMLQMRFWHSMSVAEISRAMRVDQKPLYRKLERLLTRLRAMLLARGITAQWIGERFEESVQ